MACTASRRSGYVQSLYQSLTPAEKRVVDLLVRGLTNKEAADVLFVSPRTVDFHRTSIFAKFGVKNRVQLTLKMAGAA